MARQKGPLKYIGTIGDIRHFKIKGQNGYFAGMIGGPTAEQIATDPVFARTRENMNEFAGSANAAKAVRVAFSEIVKRLSDSQLTGRLTGIMKTINKEDGSEARGQRAILVSQVPQYLKGVEFNKNVSFSGVFNAPYSITQTPDRTSSNLLVPVFNPRTYIKAPAGATHFRLINAVGVIADYLYNPTSKIYEPSQPDLNQLVNIAYSDYIELANALPADLNVTATLPGAPALTGDVTVLNVVGIEFYQQVSSQFYLFNGGNSAKIDRTF